MLITGVSRGLGLALVRAFAARSVRVVGCARGAEAVRSLRAEFGPPHSFAKVDVSDAAAVEDWVGHEVERGGVPFWVVNNAAVIHNPQPMWEVEPVDIAQLLAVNVGGTLNVIRAVMPHLLQRGTGMIINMSSGAGRMGLPRIGVYCATKWAVEGLSHSLATELPGGIGVVALSPGMVNTDMLQTCYPDEARNYPEPNAWAAKAADYMLQLSPADCRGEDKISRSV